MYCGKCGNNVRDGVAFCPKCGNKMAVVAKPQPTRKAPALPARRQNDLQGLPIATIVAGLMLLSIVLGFVSCFLPFYTASVSVLGYHEAHTFTTVAMRHGEYTLLIPAAALLFMLIPQLRGLAIAPGAFLFFNAVMSPGSIKEQAAEQEFGEYIELSFHSGLYVMMIAGILITLCGLYYILHWKKKSGRFSAKKEFTM